MQRAARLALARHQAELGDLDAALGVAEHLSAEFPHDGEVEETLRSLREQYPRS